MVSDNPLDDLNRWPFVRDDAPQAPENNDDEAAGQQAETPEAPVSAPEGDEGEQPEAPQAGQAAWGADEWFNEVLRNPNSIKRVPGRYLQDVFAKRDQLVFQQAVAQQELIKGIEAFEELYQQRDLDALDELAQKRPDIAAQWYQLRGQRLAMTPERAQQAYQQQAMQAAQERQLQRLNRITARLAENPEAKTKVDQWLADHGNSLAPTDEALDEFNEVVTQALVEAKVKPPEESNDQQQQQQRTRSPRPPTGSGLPSGLADPFADVYDPRTLIEAGFQRRAERDKR